ncbi:hypothetical protein Slin15195_G007100 [Septoria linicola]|uniref:Uncharacterized protein n=1 Tax=Septoria linicola TaxID=215465 RepID=A0A9Q9AK36_9PEZI|nr:hypothetical protein Slin14017_G007110 [Septoria linicola]USW47391.1 hypothetical protein Slin15195_G007100 [Septoria linicola]
MPSQQTDDRVVHSPIQDKRLSGINTSEELADKAESQSALEYPTAYDRIHLSNVPDYIGGTFATFLYAIPLVHPGPLSYVTSNCLRNPPRFKSHNHFNHEYIGLWEPQDLQQLFHVRMDAIEDPERPVVVADYAQWRHVPLPNDLPNLMPRKDLKTWLYRLFLKIALPK